MAHWSQRYVGRAYVEGKFDCADMARLVQLEVFKREVNIPGSRDYADKQGIARVRAQHSQIQRGLPSCATRTDSPQDGDGVLLAGRGYVNHVGVYCVINGEAYVLHAARGYRQAVLSKVRDLPFVHGLKVEGYYRWI